jgi:hypothetical protein
MLNAILTKASHPVSSVANINQATKNTKDSLYTGLCLSSMDKNACVDSIQLVI